MRVLITGIRGSGGRYMADYLCNETESEVYGLARWRTAQLQSGACQKIKIFECDLTDLSSVIRSLEQINPDLIINLASHANVRAAFDTPLSVLQNNVMSTANLFEAVRLTQTEPKILHCSTSEVYGQVSEHNVPISEECPINPSSPYAVSKVAQDFLASTYWKSFGIKVVRTRMFTYFNPRRSDLFATAFAMQVARIEHGLQSELLHGNLDSIRTMIDVRDCMEAYWLAATLGEPGEVYNIGGETSISVGDFLETLKTYALKEIPCRLDAKLLRPTDVTLQIPDVSKFKLLTGWSPKYSFDESVKHLLDECREQVRSQISL